MSIVQRVFVVLLAAIGAFATIVGTVWCTARALQWHDRRHELRQQTRDRHPSRRARRVAETAADPALNPPLEPVQPETVTEMTPAEKALFGAIEDELARLGRKGPKR